jgi:hypothetical protein
VRAHGLQLVEQRLVRSEPLVGDLAAGTGGLLCVLATLGEVGLGFVGAGLSAPQLRLEALGPGAISACCRNFSQDPKTSMT